MIDLAESDVIGSTREKFTGNINGHKTDLFTLQNDYMLVNVTNYGGRIVNLLVPDKKGRLDDIVLGFNSLDGYLNAKEQYFGATIGRYANRIKNGVYNVNDIDHQLDVNDPPNHLHGGNRGFHNVVWKAEKLDDCNLRLYYVSPDGENGYTGTLCVQVQYQIIHENTLQIDYSAFCSKNSIINLTNHAFFNLKGSKGGSIDKHELQIEADHYTPIDANLIPVGILDSVKGTPFDFTEPKEIGSRITLTHPQLQYGKGYDHNYVLTKKHPLSKAAKVVEPESGRVLELFTTEPGLQFYSGNFLDGSDIGKNGTPYNHRSAFCLEPQHYPDSPNNPHFPSTNLEKNTFFHSKSLYKLSTK